MAGKDIRKEAEKLALKLLERVIAQAYVEGATPAQIDHYLRDKQGIADPDVWRARVESRKRAPLLGEIELRNLGGRDEFRSELGLPPAPPVAAGDLVLDPQDPIASARIFVASHYTVDGVLALRHQAGVFYRFEHDASAYYERDEPAVRAEVWRFLESAKLADGKPFRPNTSTVGNMLSALEAVSNLATSIAAPAWLTDADPKFAPIDMMACRNGLLHIPSRELLPATPHFFTLNGIDFGYDAQAPEPTQWLKFLSTVWPDDQESIDTLQEIFGYVLTPDTRFQKAFMVIGPKRSGKGTIARVLGRLVGPRNTCSPRLGAFGRDFGTSVLVGKTLATIADARISARTDTAAVAETLLSISGEDAQTIERKFLPDWNGKLAVRFLLLANAVPKIGDDSGALTSRFIVLRMTRSFLGEEDLGLFDKLTPELTGILNWALAGRDRLYARGYFQQPESAADLIEVFNDLSSPEKAFVEQRCELGDGETSAQELYDEWVHWCVGNGHKYQGTLQTFSRSLHAALPSLVVRRPRRGDGQERPRMWQGIRLKAPSDGGMVRDADGLRDPNWRSLMTTIDGVQGPGTKS